MAVREGRSPVGALAASAKSRSSGHWLPKREATAAAPAPPSMRRSRRWPTASRKARPCCPPRRARRASCFARATRPAAGRCSTRWSPKGANVADSATALRNLLGPYFDLLARDGSGEAAAAMFRASQLLQRPGVAQTQAILARQYSAGNDEGSALFRLAIARTREIVRQEAEIRRLEALAERTPAQDEAIAAGKSSLEAMQGRTGPAAGAAQRLSALQGAEPANGGARRAAGGAAPRRGLLQDDGGRRCGLRACRHARIGAWRSSWAPAQRRWRRTSPRCATASSGSRMARR